jgi:large subunit ribosomal protein L13
MRFGVSINVLTFASALGEMCPDCNRECKDTNIILTKTFKKVDSLSFKTISANAATAQKEWVVIDANGEVLGRLASQVAKILRGKNKPSFTPHADCGDNVIVINADKVCLTGKKMTDKVYVRHTGYPGGQRFETPEGYLKRRPTFVIEHAVKGMLPKNRLGAVLLKNLKVYAGSEHPHEAQSPKVVKLSEIK